jgi:UDP-N-acetylglucosamine/UDP-N-acetylgalactosamine diphosphorylase
MVRVPEDLWQKLKNYGQEHTLAWWDHLQDGEREELVSQLQALDLKELRRLFSEREKSFPVPSFDRISPLEVVQLDADNREARRLGEESLDRGEVAVLLVAGGQGSRLGFPHPKGMYPIGPVSNKSLFQIHAEKVLARSRRHGKPIPFMVMTSPATHEETESFFKEHRYFGLPAGGVFFFCQGTMPALDMKTGKLLLETKGRLFTSPNGHGGTLTALAETGLLEQMRGRGIRQVFYFQVDNPLVKVADPVLLGHHLKAEAEISSKVVAKESPHDKLGNMVLIDGRCSIIEYSDLPDDLANQRDETGQLRIWVGNPAIHIFSVEFLSRVTQRQSSIPFHVARKKVPHVDGKGMPVNPERENALKFEKFIFDVFPLAKRWTAVETSRQEEFVPLKNASGADSPTSVRQAMCHEAATWLEKAGVRVPRQTSGEASVPLEINPLFALDAEELAAKVDPSLKIEGPLYLGTG